MLQSHTTQLGDGGSVRFLVLVYYLPQAGSGPHFAPAPLLGETLYIVSATLTEIST